MWRKPRLTLSPTRAREDDVTRPTRRNAISRLHSGHDDLIPGCTGHRRRSCGHRRRRPGRGDRLVRRHARPRGHAHRDQRGAGGPRSHAVGPRRRGRRDPAPGPAAPGLADREVPRPQRARASAAGLPGDRHRRRVLRRCGTRACGCSTTRRAAAPRTPGSTSCTRATPAACWWSSSNPPLTEGGPSPHDQVPHQHVRECGRCAHSVPRRGVLSVPVTGTARFTLERTAWYGSQSGRRHRWKRPVRLPY